MLTSESGSQRYFLEGSTCKNTSDRTSAPVPRILAFRLLPPLPPPLILRPPCSLLPLTLSRLKAERSMAISVRSVHSARRRRTAAFNAKANPGLANSNLP
eukprot:GHVT01002634.1.p1 GENE.GHVT01002634.1~~GHVT01002634.1.p1  ORF type:complete len:100 (+),score=13.35 GHVT01002634.1:55-354(+)